MAVRLDCLRLFETFSFFVLVSLFYFPQKLFSRRNKRKKNSNKNYLNLFSIHNNEKIIILTDKPAAWFSFIFVLPSQYKLPNCLVHIFNIIRETHAFRSKCTMLLKVYLRYWYSLPRRHLFGNPPFVVFFLHSTLKHICKLLYTTHRPSKHITLQNRFLNLKKKNK